MREGCGRRERAARRLGHSQGARRCSFAVEYSSLINSVRSKAIPCSIRYYYTSSNRLQSKHNWSPQRSSLARTTAARSSLHSNLLRLALLGLLGELELEQAMVHRCLDLGLLQTVRDGDGALEGAVTTLGDDVSSILFDVLDGRQGARDAEDVAVVGVRRLFERARPRRAAQLTRAARCRHHSWRSQGARR